MTVAPGRASVRLRGAPPIEDVLLALGLALFAQVDLRLDLDNSDHYGSTAATATVVTLATLALAWRRTHPLATVAVVAAVTAGPELVTELTITLWGHFVPLLVACYSVARWCGRRGAVAGAVIAAGAIAVMMLRVPAVATAGNVPFTLVPLTIAFATGRVLRSRAEHHRELTRRTEHLERLDHERETRLREAVDEERSRIARDLHDVVAHCVSVMVVQAGASEDLLDRDPARARESLRAVQETGQQAVAELGRMLGLLREEDGGPTLAPQPGVARLHELATRMSDLGLPVQLSITGAERPLPPGVDLTAYRIVQEALTNTLRHAGPDAKAYVELDYRPGRLDVEVLDDGHPDRDLTTTGSGHGVIGMTERASVYGGSLEVGTRPEGGFRVHASLPVAPT